MNEEKSVFQELEEMGKRSKAKPKDELYVMVEREWKKQNKKV